MACSLVLWRNDSILRSTNTNQPTPLSLSSLTLSTASSLPVLQVFRLLLFALQATQPTAFLLPCFSHPPIFFPTTRIRHYRAASRAFVGGERDEANRQRNSVFLLITMYIYIYIRCVYICRFVGGEKYRRLCGLSRLVCPSVGLGVSHERSTRLKVRGV